MLCIMADVRNPQSVCFGKLTFPSCCPCSMSGVLEFWDTSDMTMMSSAEHLMATDVEWDPTGRYVVTAVSWWGHKVDNAYWVWNFQVR